MTPYQAYEVCLNENKRKLELEPIILTNAYYSYCYALNIIKGRWLEAEAIILTDPYYSFCYALYVIKGRWTEAETKIKQDEILWHNYCSYFNIEKDKCNWKVGL